MSGDKIWFLGRIDLFAGLPKDKLEEIERLFRMKLYCRGHVVYQPGESKRVYIVKTGKVEVSRITEDGQKYIVDILSKGSVFGNTGDKLDEETFVETLDDSYICDLNKDEFFGIISREPIVAEKLLRNLFDKLILAEKKAASLATDNVVKRFAKLMISLGRNGSFDKMITDRYTHEQLGHMLGVSRQTITTLVNKMEREGRLKRVKKRMIFNPDELDDLAN